MDEEKGKIDSIRMHFEKKAMEAIKEGNVATEKKEAKVIDVQEARRGKRKAENTPNSKAASKTKGSCSSKSKSRKVKPSSF